MPFLPLAALCTSVLVQADAPEPASRPRHHVTLFEENDFFAHVSRSDKHYTQGLRLEERCWEPTGPDGTGDPLFVPRSFYAGAGHALWFENGLAIGHEIYTPENITDPFPQPDDRPYVAWLYLGFLTTVSDAEERWQDTWELDVGMIGPAALGDEIQSGWHELIGQDDPTWAEQLPNELGVIAGWKRQWVHDTFELGSPDWGILSMTSLGVRLGNVKTDLGVGARFLFGYRVPPDFEAGRGLRAVRNGGGLRVYGFFGLEGKVTPYDAFLDGTVFRESASISRKYLVADFSAGVVLRLGEVLGLSYAQVFRTGEISTDPRYHNFGSIALSVSFSF